MPYAGIEQIGGKTLVWNQMVDSGTTSVATISGHKYYTLIDGTASIITSSGSAISIVDDSADMVCDLTLMFGSGNEPSTTADFTAIFGATHYAYNEGELLSAGVTEVVSRGKNLADYTNPDNLFVATTVTNRAKTSDTGGHVLINGARVTLIRTVQSDGLSIILGTLTANTAYILSVIPTNIDGYVYVEKVNGSVSDNFTVTRKFTLRFVNNTVTFTPNEDGIYEILFWSNNTNNISAENVRLESGSTMFTNTYPIPTAIRNLEGYGWSAGTVYNYVDFERKKFVKNVDRVVLNGTQTISDTNWQATENGCGWIYPYTLTNNKVKDYNDLPNIVSDKLLAKKYPELQQHNVGISTYNYNERGIVIWQNDISLNTATAINNYLSANPITVYYELATPVEVDISAYLTDDNLINVKSGGTLTFPNQHGDDYRLPVPSEEEYMIDLQSAL